MKLLLTLSLLILSCVIPAFSQSDTTYLYFNEGWRECSKDSAYYYGKVYKQDDLWGRKDYWIKGNVLQMEASYRDKECKTGQGIFKWYRKNGTLNNTTLYENGKAKVSDIIMKVVKKGHIVYTPNGSQQNGWDEQGREIPGYIVEREAMFPGGTRGWQSYLEQSLNADVAAKSKAKPGIYTVQVQFIVDKGGNISNVHTIQVPDGCIRCGKEAFRVIKNGPKWEPAVQDNKPVLYQAIQQISFQVTEI